jgi:type I restriction enzyme S subunit
VKAAIGRIALPVGIKPLGSVTEIVMGQAPPGADCNKEGRGTVFVKAGEFNDRFPIVCEWTTKPLKLAKSGDVLVCVVGATAGKVNQAINCAIGRSVATVRPSSMLSPEYLYHFLLTKVLYLRSKSQGLAQGVITREMLSELSIPFPSFPEQQHIAAILDQADALRAKRRQALVKLDKLNQSLFLDLFGDPLTNPKGWERIPLGQKVERITKGESPKWQGFDYQNDGALFVTSENVRLGSIDLSSPKFVPLEFNQKLFRSELKPGDLLVNLVGASIGRSCIFPGYGRPSNINQAVAVVTVDGTSLNNTFLSGLLTTERGQWMLLNNRVEGARANISLTDLRELVIPMPPISLQSEFARRVETVEKLKTAQQASLYKLDALFASLQHRAFRAEL